LVAQIATPLPHGRARTVSGLVGCAASPNTGLVIPPGGTITIADPLGPGTIMHLWLTQWSRRVLGIDWDVPEPDLLRTLMLRVT